VTADWKLSKCGVPRMTFVAASCRPSVLRKAEIREPVSLISVETSANDTMVCV
jgi:hypothetical protein